MAVRAAARTFLSRRLHLGAVWKVCTLQLSRSSPPARALMARRFAQGLKSCGPNFSGRKVADQLFVLHYPLLPSHPLLLGYVLRCWLCAPLPLLIEVVYTFIYAYRSKYTFRQEGRYACIFVCSFGSGGPVRVLDRPLGLKVGMRVNPRLGL